ncbi:extensin, partial [Streptomyces sp. ventii]|nr:extensin [Streptomyces spiramenti]
VQRRTASAGPAPTVQRRFRNPEPPPAVEPPPSAVEASVGPPVPPPGSGPLSVARPARQTTGKQNRLDVDGLSDRELDQLARRLISRVTRLVRTELRMDRERIGRLRDSDN